MTTRWKYNLNPEELQDNYVSLCLIIKNNAFNPLTVTPLFEKLESALFKVKLL